MAALLFKMKQPDPLPTTSSIGRALGPLLLLLLVLVGVGTGGYLLGRAADQPAQAATPTLLPLVQIKEVEVTREITVLISATPPPPTAVDRVTVKDLPQPAETPVVPDLATAAGMLPPSLDGGPFAEVWSIIAEEFDGELPTEKDRVYGAIAGSLNALDDEYTRFLRPEIAERMRDDLDGSVSGIGAFVRETKDGNVEIVRPMDGQPADLAGVLPGDIIIAVDGQPVLDLGFDEVLLMVRGPVGTAVTLTLVREGEPKPLDIEVVRALFEVAVVESEMLGSEDRPIAYVRLSSFTHSAENSILDALTPLLSQNPEGIILDLRDNGGGFLDQAVRVADLFLPEGVVLFERSDNGLNETFESLDGGIAEDLPLVVLVNAGSASASEIVAGAIQDNERGVLIGETTFGKGSVQHVHTLSDGSELRVTIARWYTPNNRSISDNGITPDVEVPTPPDLGGDEDTQLNTAVEFLLNPK